HLPAVQPEEAARHTDRGRLARAVWADDPEHLPCRDLERHVGQRRERAIPLDDAIEREHGIRRHCQLTGISASTGMPVFRIPRELSTLTLMRYTSLDRSSAVWTFRGVNSALGEMNVMVPSRRCPVSVTSVAGWPIFSLGTSGSSTYTFA